MTDWKFTGSLPPLTEEEWLLEFNKYQQSPEYKRIDWWWMVRSGLEEPASEYVQPRVSPYRLATHLTSAFVIYCGILWTALSVVIPEPPSGSTAWVQSAAKVQKITLPVSILGHAYNTFPKMGDSWIPDDIFSMEPLICNFFGNTSTVQDVDCCVMGSLNTSYSLLSSFLAKGALEINC